GGFLGFRFPNLRLSERKIHGKLNTAFQTKGIDSLMKNRIQELRREQNLTLDALSEQIGVSQETIRAYEAGIQDPPPEILIKLAQKLNASIDYIFCQSASRQA